ncbi:ribosomal-processing cysteine protease Prp [Paenibacillus sp. GCM10012307]|uniref:Ribosomal processing cysteine protease Prp n=1 Tax=Paenibacillus roseus TaxID=2798579 RepID=A0A934MM51_9BACL|nr:ribosomal-processing cysteine protease Prp [Paenibacillus roseus]MBJ6362935.1 ribosomal-processing cysteine protease Prp [Paenibacillus roseus]
MISVYIVRRSPDRRIMRFSIEGHANFADRGKDIVCAGVSAVSVGAVNSVEALAGVQLPASMKDGWLSSDVPEEADADKDAKVQLLLESMVVMLDSIQQSYGRYVVIREQLL